MLNNLQYLRGIAALLVTVGHTLQLFAEKISPIDSAILNVFAQCGAVGVDIFFVISGFIMFYISPPDTIGPRATGQFWLRRLIRVMPLYWVMTTIVLCFYLTGIPRSEIDLGFDYIVRSYLLLPVESLRGIIEPIMPVGWTLMYEMYFYFCFGLLLLVPGRMRVAAISIGMLLLVSLGLLTPGWKDGNVFFAVYSSPLLLEFLFGVWIARAYQSGLRIPTALGWALMVVGFLILLPSFDGVELTRSLISGIPAAAIVLGAVMLHKNQRPDARVIGPLKTLGDVSYSLYLGHPVMLFGISFATRYITSTSDVVFALGCIAALAVQIGFAVFAFRWLERPMTDALNARVFRRKPRVAQPQPGIASP